MQVPPSVGVLTLTSALRKRACPIASKRINNTTDLFPHIPDNDDSNNLREFIAGANPSDETDFLRITDCQNGVDSFTITWPNALTPNLRSLLVERLF